MASSGIRIGYRKNTNSITVVQCEYAQAMCLVYSSSTTIINLRTTHCCSSGGSRSAAAGEGRRGRGGEATEDGFGRAGGDTSGVAASLTASVRLALAGSKTRQRLADGYRSARRGKSVDSADLSAMDTVFPGVYSERRQKSPRVPEGKARSLSARSL